MTFAASASRLRTARPALKIDPKSGGGILHDPEFDGKEPVEVIQLMSRAKRWLEARGYEINLSGFCHIRKQVKFQ